MSDPLIVPLRMRVAFGLGLFCLAGLGGLFLWIAWLVGGFGAAYFAFCTGCVGGLIAMFLLAEPPRAPSQRGE